MVLGRLFGRSPVVATTFLIFAAVAVPAERVLSQDSDTPSARKAGERSKASSTPA